MIFEWGHVKEAAIIVFSAIVGWIGFKAKQKDQIQIKHENTQDNRLDELDKRLNAMEKHGAAIEERTKSIQSELGSLKQDLNDDFRDLKGNISLLIRKVIDNGK
tara:strand:- start:11122 stop:11433 length:312 start_codon:yes stop_codon:yes gene_type:complete